MKNPLEMQFTAQHFANDYQLVNGAVMHAQNPTHFHIPPDVIKRHVGCGQFVELRMDSPRFSVHEDAAEQCSCPCCNGQLSKPILRHEQPASLRPQPEQQVPSRGWGEDFWVRIEQRAESYFRGIVDNPLVEARLHGVHHGDELYFHEDHILAIHDIHRKQLLMGMDVDDLKELAAWIHQMRK